MNKFKLIKEYPGSPKLGFVVDFGTTYDSINSSMARVTILLKNCKDSPEFWEEIEKEKQYQILIVIPAPNNKVGKETVLKEYQNYLTDYWRIKSINRFPDYEIFTIGDKIICQNSHIDKPEAITKIELNKEGTPCLYTNSFDNHGINIFKAIKVKKLLTTEDCVDLYQGDDFWHVDPWFGISKGSLRESTFIPLRGYTHFSTQEAAKNYIDLNKKQYSIKNVIDSSIDVASTKNYKFLSLDILKSCGNQ